ncbi:MAG TPA: hypothetical protein VIK81_01960 [Patescibacteria group bacterium]
MAKKRLNTKKLPQQLTHISRINSRTVFFGFTIAILALINFFYSSTALDKQLANKLIKNPKNESLHVETIQLIAVNNDLQKAGEELIETLSNSDSREAKNLFEQIKTLQAEPSKVHQKIVYWEEIVKVKNNYRDGYFQLSLLYWQVYDEVKSREYLNKTLLIDPNFIPAWEFEKFIYSSD